MLFSYSHLILSLDPIDPSKLLSGDLFRTRKFLQDKAFTNWSMELSFKKA